MTQKIGFKDFFSFLFIYPTQVTKWLYITVLPMDINSEVRR